MARRGTIVADIVAYLSERERTEAPLPEIIGHLRSLRRSEVRPHSVRSSIYQHLGDKGERLFVRCGRGRYRLRLPSD